jgi:excisionase family DNA binding protein
MSGLTLREAAEQAGVSKATLTRAVKAGRLPAAQLDGRSYRIHPDDLFRAYPAVGRTTTAGAAGRHPAGTEQPQNPELLIRAAALEAELRVLKGILAKLNSLSPANGGNPGSL